MRDQHAHGGAYPEHLKPYLAFSRVIDGDTPAVAEKAAALAAGCTTDADIVARCFEFVRDGIRHSGDVKANPVTASASDVLRHGTGYCYAKSHLLAALLRANGIPAALCYQRLMLADDGSSFCLHGLNAVHLDTIGWYRIDARGNKPGIDARFCPPFEMLAYPALHVLERDLRELWIDPLPQVIGALTAHASIERLAMNFPDIAMPPQRQAPGAN